MALQMAANLSLLFPTTTAWEARCERAAAAGFRCVEILFPYDRPAEHYRAMLDQYGLHCVLINTPVLQHKGLAAVRGAEAEFRLQLQQACEAANVLGAPAIHVMAGAGEQGSLCEATFLRNLEFAVTLAEQQGVRLQLEALNSSDVPGYFYHDPVRVQQWLAAYPPSRLGLQFDFYHTKKQGLALAACLDQTAAQITHIQLAGVDQRAEPVCESLEYQQALRRIETMGYAGVVGLEYVPRASLEAGLAWLSPWIQSGILKF